MTNREQDLKAAFAEAISEVGIDGLKATSMFGSQPDGMPDKLWCWNFQNEEGSWEKGWGGYARPNNLFPMDERERNTGAIYTLVPQPVTVQDAARVPEIAALIEAAKAANPHIRGAIGFTLNAALRAIAEGRA